VKSGKLSESTSPWQDPFISLPHHQEESQSCYSKARCSHDRVAYGAALFGRLGAVSAKEATEAILEKQEKGH